MSTGDQSAPGSEDELAKLRSDLDAANKELESLSYAVSHDLRAPLRAIEGFADVVLEDYQAKLDAEGKRYLEIIRSSSLKASKMIEGLLLYSRLGRHEMTKSDINVAELIQNAITDLRHIIGDRKIDFKIDSLPAVRGDFFLLREIWKNLLANAVKFSRLQPETVIRIEGHEKAGSVTFSISDNGVGFDQKYADKLFQLFQRLHGESEFNGIGVGLAVARRLVLRHGGTIWAEGKPGEGATFFFTLPK